MIPQNEMGVLVVFSQMIRDLNIEIVNIQSAFPDLTILIGDNKFNIELEFVASNFVQHKHNFDECDIIICWENDLEDYKFPIIALSSGNLTEADFRYPLDWEREILRWRYKAMNYHSELARVRAELEVKTMMLAAESGTEILSVAAVIANAVNKRRDTIVSLLNSENPPTQIELAKMFSVSTQTIRTDVRALRREEPTQGYLAEQTGVSVQTIRGDIKALNGSIAK
jgi:hypothetical protein